MVGARVVGLVNLDNKRTAERVLHHKYNYQARNVGKDLIFQTRLRLVEKLNIDKTKNLRLWHYVTDAELGILLIP